MGSRVRTNHHPSIRRLGTSTLVEQQELHAVLRQAGIRRQAAVDWETSGSPRGWLLMMKHPWSWRMSSSGTLTDGRWSFTSRSIFW